MAMETEELMKKYNLDENFNVKKGNNNTSNSKSVGNGKVYKIPEKTALVWTNLFTGNVNIVKGPHLFKFNFMWRQDVHYVDLKEQTVDYPPKEYHTKDQIKAETDIFLKYEIINPRTYILKSADFTKALDVEVQRMMRFYFANHDYDNIKNKKLSITDINESERKLTQNNNGTSIGFSKLEHEYGIKITDIGTKTLKFPDLIDDTTKRKEQQLAHDRMEAEIAFNEKVLPKIKANEIVRAQTVAESETIQLKAIKEALEDLPKDKVAEILEARYYAQGNVTNINETRKHR